MAQDFGVTNLGTINDDSIFTSARVPRTIDITVTSGQGVLAKGTLMSKDTNGEYIIHDGTKDIAGFLNEAVDATSESVKTYLCFDADVSYAALYSATAINVGFDHPSLLNIQETL